MVFLYHMSKPSTRQGKARRIRAAADWPAYDEIKGQILLGSNAQAYDRQGGDWEHPE